MAPTKIRSMEPVPKRTRVSRGQSKNGCFTCKSRKVKCDEEKPFCSRCRNARLQCDGYPATAYLTPATYSRSSSSASSRTAREPRRGSIDPSESADFNTFLPPILRSNDSNQPQLDLFQAGLDLLLNSYEDHFVLGQALLRKLLTQYSTSSSSVRAACAALGAARELQKRSNLETDQLQFHFATHYGSAIRLIRQELEDHLYDPNSIVATCIILGSIDYLRYREADAALHLRGAHQAFRSYMQSLHGHYPILQEQTNIYGHLTQVSNQETGLLLQLFDVQNVSTTKGASSAVVEPVSFDVLEQIFLESQHKELSDNLIVPTIHAITAFLATAVRAIRLMLSGGPRFDYADQSQRYLDLTERWISLLAVRLSGIISEPDRIRLLVIQNWFQYCFILFIGQFGEDEMVWDTCAIYFQRIVVSAEEIIQARQRTRQSESGPAEVLSFTPMIGISQPLYLSAAKYRHRLWRRRAIACLQNADREGSWIGKMVATTVGRLIEIEESAMIAFEAIDSIDDSAYEGGLNIPAAMRVSTIRMPDTPSLPSGTSWPSAYSKSVDIEFMRRTQPISLMSSKLYSGTSAAAGEDSEGAETLNASQLQEEAWECWIERIDFGAAPSQSPQWSKLSDDNLSNP